MGSCLSIATAPLLDETDGDEAAYQASFVEDQILGEGEFGVVKLVHSTNTNNNNERSSKQPFASKMLRKGVTFKDNVMYSPLKPEVLRGEIAMLRTLAGQNFCLKLQAVFETKKNLYVVTEYCAGGELIPYIANLQEEIRSEDVSRIAYQMFSAIAHCHQHHIVHRDVKPENWMFTDPSPGAEGRLIDFGSGTLDTTPGITHTTFAGSAFYISPEMFQRTYTQATDVWSVGVTLYVLVAGFPANDLQKAFNILQTAGPERQLRQLPHVPDNLPASFFDLLDRALTYRYKKRPSAATLLQHEFVTFHQEDSILSLDEVVSAAASKRSDTLNKNKNNKKNQSVTLAGSVVRHNVFLGFQQFERAVTTLLATMLSPTELAQLLHVLQDRAHAAVGVEPHNNKNNATTTQPPKNQLRIQTTESMGDDGEEKQAIEMQTLSVVKVAELKSIISGVLKNDPVLEALEKLPNAELYDSFAYHTAFLNDFGRGGGDYIGNAASLSASMGKRRRGSMRGGGGSMRQLKRSSSFSRNKSGSSVRSMSPGRRGGGGSSRGRHSVAGSNVFAAAAAASSSSKALLEEKKTNVVSASMVEA